MKSETILLYENAYYRLDDVEKEGIIVITDYRFIFIFSIPEEEYLYFQLLAVSKLDKTNDKKSNGKYYLDIITKDNRTFKFYISRDDQQKLYHHLSIFANPKDTNIYYKFAVKYRENHPVNYDGWEIYDPFVEYERQGLRFENYKDEVK